MAYTTDDYVGVDTYIAPLTPPPTTPTHRSSLSTQSVSASATAPALAGTSTARPLSDYAHAPDAAYDTMDVDFRRDSTMTLERRDASTHDAPVYNDCDYAAAVERGRARSSRECDCNGLHAPRRVPGYASPDRSHYRTYHPHPPPRAPPAPVRAYSDSRDPRDSRDGPPPPLPGGGGGGGGYGGGDGGRGGYGAPMGGAPHKPTHAPRAEPNNVLGVFGLSIRTREIDLEDEFARVGQVDKVVIVYDQRTDRSRGFGFITMRSIEDAERAIEKLNGINLHGRPIRVDFSATQKPHAPTPGEYRGATRYDYGVPPRRFDDRRPGGYDDRRGGYDDRRAGPPGGYGRDDRSRDRDYGAPRRDYDDPYGGRSRRDEYERRRSPSPRRARYESPPDRRAPLPPPPAREYDAPAYDAPPPPRY